MIEDSRCRICYDGSNLISPCGCNGSMKLIHRECLEKWRFYNNDSMNCEICKEKYKVYNLDNHHKIAKTFFSIIIGIAIGLCISYTTDKKDTIKTTLSGKIFGDFIMKMILDNLQSKYSLDICSACDYIHILELWWMFLIMILFIYKIFI